MSVGSVLPPTVSSRYERNSTLCPGVPNTWTAPAARFTATADVPTSMFALRSFSKAPSSIISVTPCGTISPSPSGSTAFVLLVPIRYARLSPTVSMSLSVPALPTTRTTLDPVNKPGAPETSTRGTLVRRTAVADGVSVAMGEAGGTSELIASRMATARLCVCETRNPAPAPPFVLSLATISAGWVPTNRPVNSTLIGVAGSGPPVTRISPERMSPKDSKAA